MHIDLKQIKLIIWDLDGSLWKGVLSEGEVSVPREHIKLVRDLADCGIMQSICSKNDFGKAQAALEKAGIWELFVFPSISWESKGPHIQEILKNMSLRAENTLFIDDNASNRGEAEFFAPGIATADPEIIIELIHEADCLERSNPGHERLQRYRTLEKRVQAAEAFTDSERFLYDSDIRAKIHHDCLAHVSRIHDLITRTNQLNFTKKRLSREEVESLLGDPSAECGYITSQDKYGDYGIIGFYALKDGNLEHFAFSCRTMGQRIEQWVYAQLGFPEIEVKGEVATHLNRCDCPGWINQNCAELKTTEPEVRHTGSHVLLKGPCDLSHSQVYLKNNGVFDSELGYTTAEGKIVAAHNHSVQIEGLYTYSEQDKAQIAHDCIFVDPPMLNGRFFTGGYDLIVLSTSFESYYQTYRKKGTDLRVAFAGVNLTNPDNWPGLIDGSLYTGGNTFTQEYLQEFSEKYEYTGVTTPAKYIAFLQRCLKWLPSQTHLCLILGATDGIEETNVIRFRHEKLNGAVKEFAKSHPRISYIEVDDFIKDASDYLDGINHFSARVYYELAQAIAETIRKATGKEVVTHSSGTVAFDSVMMKMRKCLSSVVSPNSSLYKPMKKVYDRFYKKRS